MFWLIVFIGILSVFFPFVLKGFILIALLPLLSLLGIIALGAGIVLAIKLILWVFGMPFRLF